ncbi:MAG TPA: ATP-binding protein [Steroidobacteraceae bacterium]|nr:ATP-binding protein [Steroidobacteraceae bacterium]
MFISVKRHEREKQDVIGASNRLTDAILKSSVQGMFLLDAKDKVQPQVSASLAAMFRRQDFSNVSFDKLLTPLVTAKTLSAVRAFMTRLFDATLPFDASQPNPLQDVEVRRVMPDGAFETAHYSFDFHAVDSGREPRAWLVRVTDITARVQQQRELEDLRTHMQTQGEILRSVLQSGGARFGAFLQRTDAAMKTINGVLKKPAREADAFRSKLEETLEEVDRVRRDAAALKLTGLEAAARLLEDSLQELRSRGALSGSDFLPLAVKLDQLYGQFALLRSLSTQSGPLVEADEESPDTRMTENGTQIIEAPQFLAQMAKKAPASHKSATPKAHRMAPAGSLDSTLSALTELVAQEYKKTVVLDCIGIQLVPPRYQATIKNVAIQLIRNAVMHGVESSAARISGGKPAHGTLHLEFKALPDQSFELHFQDDGCGLDPDRVRATAVAKGLLNEEAASRLRDRQAIKLIFKSGYTTLESAPGEAPHGSGMSLVRRYVHEAGGKIALATLLGHETRFKVTLPAVAAADAQVA